MPGRQEGHANRDQKWNHAAKITRGHSDAQKAGKPPRRPSLGPSGTHEPPAHATKEGLQQLQRDNSSNPPSWRQLDSSHLRNELDRAVKDLDIYMRIFSCNSTWINIHKSLKNIWWYCTRTCFFSTFHIRNRKDSLGTLLQWAQEDRGEGCCMFQILQHFQNLLLLYLE